MDRSDRLGHRGKGGNGKNQLGHGSQSLNYAGAAPKQKRITSKSAVPLKRAKLSTGQPLVGKKCDSHGIGEKGEGEDVKHKSTPANRTVGVGMARKLRLKARRSKIFRSLGVGEKQKGHKKAKKRMHAFQFGSLIELWKRGPSAARETQKAGTQGQKRVTSLRPQFMKHGGTKRIHKGPTLERGRRRYGSSVGFPHGGLGQRNGSARFIVLSHPDPAS